MTDIAELMRRDPLQMTKEDVAEIVKTMRASRHQFSMGNVRAGSTKPKTEKQKQVSALADKLQLKINL